MVACGSLLALIASLALIQKIRKKEYSPFLLKLFVFAGPLGFLAIEAGWTVTEVGRQPWIIYGFMKKDEA
jgi:cytochrome d ubiquinol oxidase subunit I